MNKVTKHNNIRIIKVNSCKSLSGKSDLDYQFGTNEQSEIFIRITKNSGGGWFSHDWLALSNLIAKLETVKSPLTSFSLQSYFEGKSVNTAAFVFAALKEEGLVGNDPDNPRCYVFKPANSLMTTLKSLAATNISLQDTVSPIKASSPKSEYEIPVLSTAVKVATSKVKPKT